MNRRRRKINEEIPFPRKKLRDTLQHYSLGKAKKELIGVIPEEDEVREDLEPRRRVRVAAVVGERGRAELDDGERAEREEADVEEERVQLRAVVPSFFLQIFFFPLHRTRAPRTSSGGA